MAANGSSTIQSICAPGCLRATSLRPRGAEGVARLRPAEAIRGRAGKARLGPLPRLGRARLARARREHSPRARVARVAGLSHAAAQSISRPLALTRRGLSRLEPEALQPHECALERRPRA